MIVTIGVLQFLLLFQSSLGAKVGLFMPAPPLGGPRSVTFPKLLNAMLKILERYDLTVVHDYTTTSAVGTLYQKLFIGHPEYKISMVSNISRIFRPRQDLNETIGFIYNSTVFEVGEPSFDKSSGIVYAKVKVLKAASKSLTQDYQFVIGDVDIDFRIAIPEINRIPAGYERIANITGLQDVLIPGSWATSDPFISWKQYQNLNVTKDSRFQWYISYYADTVDWPIDYAANARLLGVEGIRNHVVKNSDKVFNFIRTYNLTYDEGHRITYNYPVELELDF